jgi:hypothetical protein
MLLTFEADIANPGYPYLLIWYDSKSTKETAPYQTC